MTSSTGHLPTAADVRAVRELAAALTRVEQGLGGAAPAERRPGAVVGLVGAPGVGKSTVISALVPRARARGERVVVLAVDPSSPLSGGALLGDRVRMADHGLDAGTFVRSFGSRGHPGGLAAAIPAAIDTCLALGWDTVFVEPVGGGQSDVEIAAWVDVVLLLMSPESGDDVQMLKAGILELTDIVVVNKADRPGAEAFANLVRALWHPPAQGACVTTSAPDDSGFDELDAAIGVSARRTRPPATARRALATAVDDLAAAARGALAEPALAQEICALVGAGRRAQARRRIAEELSGG